MSETLKFGNGQWAVKEGSALAYNDENGNFKPLPFTFDRSTSATRVNKEGLIEVVSNNEPRIDFLNDSKGALKLEPSRSNLITYSEAFDNAYWIKTNSSVTSGFISPDGTANAFKLVDSTSLSAKDIRSSAPITPSIGSDYTTSIIVKGSGRDLGIWSYNGTVNYETYFDLTLGTVLSGNGVIEALSDGWYKCSLTVTATTSSPNAFMCDLFITKGTTISYQGDGTSGVYIYGAQLEQGSYATSYIPTQGSIGTRVAESCSQTPSSGIIGQTEGTMYVEANLVDGYDDNNWLGIIYDSSNANNRVYIQRYLGNIQGGIRVNGAIQSEITQSSSSLGKNKIAFTYKLNEFKMFVNGSQVGVTDTSGSVFSTDTLDKLKVGVYHNDALNFNSGINDFRLYDTALSNAELQALTS